MAKRRRKTRKSQVKLQELATVAFTEDAELARDFETLLKNNDIPVIIKEQDQTEQGGVKGIAVMVPEDFLDEAHVIIESQNAYDDFYDFALEDEDEDEFEGDLFEDEL
jgi:3-methyladenine DNA glycosylase/8-oxoguanine DNA glycosylase